MFITVNAFSIALVFTSVTFVLSLLFSIVRWRTSPPTSLLDEIHLILNPPRTSERELLSQRAGSNQRLTHAFKLTNTFVSPDPDVHRVFVRHARQLLNGAQRDGWYSFRDLSTRAIQATLLSPCFGNDVPFDVFTQSVTLRVILAGLLGVDMAVEDFDQRDIFVAASHINTLWAISKTGRRIPGHILIELNTCLRRLVPNEEEFPNPLDFVIPAWETLWRVIAIAVAHSHRETDFRTVFSNLFLSPAEVRFRARDHDSVSVKDIIYESMRLYPPSKHIGRKSLRSWARHLPEFVIGLIKQSSSLRGFIYRDRKASIIGIQQSPSLWGPSAGSFDPYRHRASTPEREQVLRLVFGYGPQRCIGESWAPIAAGIISSAILESLDGGWSIVQGSGIGGRDGWDGWVVVRGADC